MHEGITRNIMINNDNKKNAKSSKHETTKMGLGQFI